MQGGLWRLWILDSRSATSGTTCFNASAAFAEKLLEQRAGFRLRQPAINLRPVMAGRRGEKLPAVVDRAALRIGGAIIKPADTGEGDRARAHGAGLERDVEVAGVEPFRAERGRSRPDRDDLGMSRRVA